MIGVTSPEVATVEVDVGESGKTSVDVKEGEGMFCETEAKADRIECTDEDRREADFEVEVGVGISRDRECSGAAARF